MCFAKMLTLSPDVRYAAPTTMRSGLICRAEITQVILLLLEMSNTISISSHLVQLFSDLSRTKLIIGLVNPRAINLIGSGCVVHIPSFFEELEALQKKGLDTNDRIFLSDRCHLVFDIHQICDGLKEAELGGKSIGTTKKGIGPTYSSKASRSGIRVHHLFDWEEFERRFRGLVVSRHKRYGEFEYDVEGELARYKVKTYEPWSNQ
jgi:adenylosuccinate synthase